MVIAKLTSDDQRMHARLAEHITPFNDALQMPDARCSITGTDSGRAMLDGC